MTTKVKLIKGFLKKGPTVPRAKLFSTLMEKLTTYEEVATNDTQASSDYVVYFDTDVIGKDGEAIVAELLSYKDRNDCRAIFDVTNRDLFDNELTGPIMTLCVVCAGFVTCATPELQEEIYEQTGRLACIVRTPVTQGAFQEPDEDQYKNIKSPQILWFGLPSEIFQVRQQQVKNTTALKINTTIVTNKTKIDVEFNKNDMVYLPETFDALGEQARATKVQLSLLAGKFVIAPKLDFNGYEDLAFNGTLTQGVSFYRRYDITKWILEKQEKLLQLEGIEDSVFQLDKALELALKDDFLDHLGYYIDNEEINI